MRCNDFDLKFTGVLVTSLTYFKAPGLLQVEIVENAVITIGLVSLFP